MKQKPIPKRVRQSMLHIIHMAQEAQCTCASTERSNGYLGHQRDCYVHMMRNDYRTVETYLAQHDGKKL